MNKFYTGLWALVLAASYTAIFALFHDYGYILMMNIIGGAALISFAIMVGFLWADFRDMNL
jgi:hypothetical protein